MNTKQTFLGLVTLLLTINVSAAPSTCTPAKGKLPFGTPVGEYNGVLAYSNCRPDYVQYKDKDDKKKIAILDYNYFGSNQYKTGIKWQCVEYVTRYYKSKFSREIGGLDARQYCDKASSKNLMKANNGSTTDKPQTGNVICSGKKDKKGNYVNYGHCAIVREVTNDKVYVIEQNFNENTNDHKHKLTLTKNKNGTYQVGDFGTDYPVTCWMWPKK